MTLFAVCRAASQPEPNCFSDARANPLCGLSEQQAEALRTATFVGMTSDEANEYDERRRKITDLIQQLALVQKSQ